MDTTNTEKSNPGEKSVDNSSPKETPPEQGNGNPRNSKGASNGVGGPKQTLDRNLLGEIVMNALRFGRSAPWEMDLDRRRSINDECGYPNTATLTVHDYRLVYDREGIPNRVVGLWPDESWILNPEVLEDEDPKISTPFEQAFDNLGKSLRGESWYEDDEGHPLWEYLHRSDILSGIGHYGVLLIGIDDGKSLEEPAEFVNKPSENTEPLRRIDRTQAGKETDRIVGRETTPSKTNGKSNGKTPSGKVETTTPKGKEPSKSVEDLKSTDKGMDSPTLLPAEKPPRKLLFLRAFDESLVQIISREEDPASPRFGKPVFYELTFETVLQPASATSQENKTGETKRVHWTRVIHIADNIESSEIFAIPRLRVHFNRCMDLRKLLGGSAEMYWRGALPATFFVTHPQLGTDVEIRSQEFKDSIEQMLNTLQRWGFVPGVTPVQLAPAVSDPSAQIDNQLDAICIKEGCPKRIFLGSERGELASSQDERAWNKRVKRRQTKYLIPRLIVPTIDRFIQLGILPTPVSYKVRFPDLDNLTDLEKADVALKRTQALTTFVAGDGIQMMTEQDWYSMMLQLTDEEAEGIVERAMERQIEVAEEEEIEREKEMEDFERQQEIIADNRPEPTVRPGSTGKPF